jgi:hypothetical protein
MRVVFRKNLLHPALLALQQSEDNGKKQNWTQIFSVYFNIKIHLKKYWNWNARTFGFCRKVYKDYKNTKTDTTVTDHTSGNRHESTSHIWNYLLYI